MYVLYVIDSLLAGGAERSLAALAPLYPRRGIRLDVAYLHDRPGVQRELESAGATMLSVAGPGGRAGRLRRMRHLVTSRRPDLVHTTLFEADVAGRVAARLAGTPVVSSLVNDAYGPAHLDDPTLSAWKVRGAQLLDAATARLAVRMHAVSRRVADVMVHRLRYPRQRVDVVPRGRDPDVLGRRTEARRAQTRIRLAIPANVPLLLAVARQEHQKGLDVLVQAFRLVRRGLPAARLLVAGRDGSQTPQLRDMVRELSLNDAVTFLGARDDVPDLLCAADAFVLPSRREGLPGSVVEAMALEVPIVASDLPEVRELVNDASAVLVPPGSPEALAVQLERVLGDPREAGTRVQRAAVAFRDRFTVERVVDQMHAFYVRALDNAR